MTTDQAPLAPLLYLSVKVYGGHCGQGSDATGLRRAGCTHFIIGRDMAGCKSSISGEDFYGPYQAQDTAKAHAAELGVQTVPSLNITYTEVIPRAQSAAQKLCQAPLKRVELGRRNALI